MIPDDLQWKTPGGSSTPEALAAVPAGNEGRLRSAGAWSPAAAASASFPSLSERAIRSSNAAAAAARGGGGGGGREKNCPYCGASPRSAIAFDRVSGSSLTRELDTEAAAASFLELGRACSSSSNPFDAFRFDSKENGSGARILSAPATLAAKQVVDVRGAAPVPAEGGAATRPQPSISCDAAPTPAAIGAAAAEGDGEVTGGDAVRQPVNLLEGRHTIVLFDLETTGLSRETDRVIQLASKVMGSRDPKHVFSVFVDPEGAPLSPKIRELTSITPEVLAENNARPFREVWPRFAAWLMEIGVEVDGGGGGSGVVLAAHNAAFDSSFLTQELSRAGVDRSMLASVGVVAFVDTLAVLRDYGIWRQSNEGQNVPHRPNGFSLRGLFRHVYGQVMPRAHDALGDVEGLEAVLSAPYICERWRQVASTNPACQMAVLHG